jgi:hypothetical protein
VATGPRHVYRHWHVAQYIGTTPTDGKDEAYAEVTVVGDGDHIGSATWVGLFMHDADGDETGLTLTARDARELANQLTRAANHAVPQARAGDGVDVG